MDTSARRPHRALFPCVATGLLSAGFLTGLLVRPVFASAPDVQLLVLVAVGLVRGPAAGAAGGFCCGLLTDLGPAAAHAAGSGALAYCLAGYLAGMAGPVDARRPDEPLRSAVAVGGAVLTLVGVFTLAAAVLGTRITYQGVLAALAETAGLTVPAGLLLVPLLTGVLRRCRTA